MLPFPPASRRSASAAIAASTNGARLIAFGVGGSGAGGGGGVWTSTNSGATWISNTIVLSDYQSCYAVASSADGTKLSIATHDGGLANNEGSIYYSTNGGTTWTLSDAPYKQWNSIACSTDGSKLVAGYSHLISFPTEVGGVYLSVNYGANWTAASLPNIDFAGRSVLVRWVEVARSIGARRSIICLQHSRGDLDQSHFACVYLEFRGSLRRWQHVIRRREL